MRKHWFWKKIEYLQSLRVGKDLLKGTEKVPNLKKSDKLDYNKNQNICKNKLMSTLSLTLFSEIYSPQKNQILVLGYLVPLSVYYTLSNGQAVSHTHTPAVNVYTWIHCRLLRISPGYLTFCEEQWEILYHHHLPPNPLMSALP